MKKIMILVLFLLTPFLGDGLILRSQVGSPLFEGFDFVLPPALPSGWSTSRARNPLQDDAASTSSIPASPPNALLLTNAMIAQEVTTPSISFEGRGAGRLRFSLRRSASFQARLEVLASTDGGETFPVSVASGIIPETDSRYYSYALPLPATLHGETRVRIRWVTVPSASGATGTLRMDDIEVTATELFDCAAGQLQVPSDPIVEGEPLEVSLAAVNAGLRPLERVVVRFGWRAQAGSEPVWDPPRDVVPGDSLPPGDSIAVPATVRPPLPGVLALCAVVAAEGDRNSLNDSSQTSLRVGAQAGRIVISEIMHAPAPGEPEWIELTNNGSVALHLQGWSVGDEADPEGRELAPPAALVAPRGFAVVAQDTVRFRAFRPDLPAEVALLAGLPSLNNTNDCLILHDPAGVVVDSVPYSALWHHPSQVAPIGRSLERVVLSSGSSDRWNWGSSVHPSGGTPGLPNSIAIETAVPHALLSASPNPFSPDNDGVDDRTVVRFENPSGAGTMSLRVFDVRGRLVRTVASNEPCAERGLAVWDGLDDERRRVRIGIYILLLQIVPSGDAPILTAKGCVVVAARL